MDPNLRLAIERVNAWHLARLRAQFLSQAAETAPESAAAGDDAAASSMEPPASPGAASAADGAVGRSH